MHTQLHALLLTCQELSTFLDQSICSLLCPIVEDKIHCLPGKSILVYNFYVPLLFLGPLVAPLLWSLEGSEQRKDVFKYKGSRSRRGVGRWVRYLRSYDKVFHSLHDILVSRDNQLREHVAHGARGG